MAQVQLQQQVPVTSQSVVPNTGANQYSPASLYVGDLDVNVNDSQLYDLFNQVGQVVSVRICRDSNTKRSLGYGYVNFHGPQDASRALDVLNFTPLNGKPIRIMYSHRDPSIRKSGTANIFIKNLEKSIDNKSLQDTFSAFGNILSCKVATDPSGQSKGFGFVQFDNEQSAQDAIDKLNGMLVNEKQVFVGPFLRKHERDSSSSPDKAKFNNVYVKNLSESTMDDDLKNIFGEYGTITSAVVMKDADGKSRCFGFVNFENADEASKAVECLNGFKFDERDWYVGKAQKKAEREVELKEKFELSVKEGEDKSHGMNLYIKNLDDSIDDEKLEEMFSAFGAIMSCKVMRDPNGISKGSGFVALSSPEEASKALSEMSGKMVINKPLYVAIAERKEERRARLQAQFLQPRAVPVSPTVGARMPVYTPGSPAVAPQVFYPQGPAIIPPQAGYGYHQLVPGMRTEGAPMPNFFMPVGQQGQHGQRAGNRRTSLHNHLNPQPVPMMQPQMIPRRGYRYSTGGRGMQDGPTPGPVYEPGMPPIHTLASALANSSPDQQRTMLGENLYPLVEQVEQEHAAKVTGMLLEMDQTEVLHLLESPDALRAKVVEAMEVLRTVSVTSGRSPAEQFAVLSLEDNLVS